MTDDKHHFISKHDNQCLLPKQETMLIRMWITKSAVIHQLCNRCCFFLNIPFKWREWCHAIHVLRLQRQTAFILSLGGLSINLFYWGLGIRSSANNLRYNGANRIKIPLVFDPIPCAGSGNGRNSTGFMFMVSIEMKLWEQWVSVMLTGSVVLTSSVWFCWHMIKVL